MPRAMRRLWIVALALGLLGSPPGACGQESRLIPMVRTTVRTGPVVPSERPARPHLNLGTPSGLRSRPAFAKAGLLSGPALPDTLRVLVLRVSFPEDEDPLTTGAGSFDLRDLTTFQAEEGHDIDAAPHDRGYAERHMLALHHYWWANSGGALSIVSGVLPSATTSSYLMPHEMAYYGFESPLGDIVGALEALIADAVTAADNGPDPVDWSAWDAFVIFHAGADWQGDISAAGDTPADIPSAYIALGSPVSVGGREIWDATVVPETVSQDGFVGGVNGVFAHEFGHQLGLPDLYDATSGETAVGLFALMDLGDFTGGLIGDLFVQGILPANLSPWTKMYMGWVNPEEIWPGAGQTLELVAAGAVDGVHAAPAGPRLALVHAAEHQAFLVEYRPDNLDGDPTIALNWNQGVIDGTARLEGTEKVLTYEYDALLPGSGVLIWHLDEEVALRDGDGDGYDDLAGNTLQADRYRRFLDLEEADGLQQLGFLPGYLGDAGDYWQPLFGGGGAELAFGPDGEPSSASWTGAPTGISVVVRAGSDPLSMAVTISAESDVRWVVPVPSVDPEVSVPWWIGSEGTAARVALIDADGGLHLWDRDGQPANGINPVWIAPSPVLFPPTSAGGVLVVTMADGLQFLSVQDGTESGFFPLSSPPLRRPQAFGNPFAEETFFVETADLQLQLVSQSGLVAFETLPAPLTASAVHGGIGLVAVAADRLLHIRLIGAAIQIVDLGSIGEAARDLVLAYDDSDGSWIAAITTVDDRLLFYRYDPNAPAPGIELLRRHVIGDIQGSPALASRLPIRPGLLNGNTVYLPTREGMRAFDLRGQPVAGWPPRQGGRAVAPLVAPSGTPMVPFDLDIFGVSALDEFQAWGRDGDPLPGSWNQLRISPVAAPTLGMRLGAPLLLVTEPDSLRVHDSHWYGSAIGDYHQAYWAGPQGGPEGTASRVMVGGPPYAYQPSIVEAFYTYPNPSRVECWIRVEGLTVDMSVHAYTASGTPLGEVARFAASPGFSITREARWDVSRLAPGVYLLVGSLAGGARRVTTTVVVIR